MTAVPGERKDKMKLVLVTEVVVGERFRQDYGDLDDLINSIQEKGIIQPISVDDNLNLLAGGRRMAAATKMGLVKIPAIIRTFVDEIDSREIELFENVYRKDFTWQEEASIIAEIDKLYKTKHPSGWSGRKTADLLDKSVAGVARNLQLAKALEIIPELGQYKTADEALKVLKQMESRAIVDELRDRQQIRMNGSDADTTDDDADDDVRLERGLRQVLKIADGNYHIGDVFTGMAGLRNNGQINIIECDPPYGIALNEQKASKDSVTSNVTSYEEVPTDAYPEFLDKLTNELYRVAGKDCWLVFWYGPTWHQQVLTSLRNAGWHVDEIPAIWAKTQGQTLQPEIYLARGYEPFFLCRKGKPVMVERGRLNVFNFPGVPGKQKYHPTQRPTALIMDIFKTLGAGRQNVFIPFLGSGASLLSCYNLGFNGFGFDLNGEYKSKFMLEVERETRNLFKAEASGALDSK